MRLSLENASYCYSKKEYALEDACISIESGDFIGVTGQTGSGKTTLIRLISGLMKPVSGKVLFNGCDINRPGFDKKELRRNLGVVFQYPEYQLFETTVKKDVGFSLKQYGINNPEEKIKKALETVGFDYDSIKDKSPFSLSGGEKRRVAIAGVIVTDPGILIFDEPLSGLDPQGRNDFIRLIKELNKKGTAVMMISHCTDALAENFDRIAVTDGGKIVYDGSAGELFTSDELAAEFHTGLPSAKKTADILYKRGVIPTDKIFRSEQLKNAVAAALKGGDNRD